MRKTLCVLLAALPAALSAGPIVYTPVNPSFGGNPLNGPNLANSANSQNKFTDPSVQSLFGRTPQSQLDLFNQRLQSLILDRIANSLSSSLFDANGNLISIVQQSNGTLLITTLDKTTGASTQFEVTQ